MNASPLAFAAPVGAGGGGGTNPVDLATLTHYTEPNNGITSGVDDYGGSSGIVSGWLYLNDNVTPARKNNPIAVMLVIDGSVIGLKMTDGLRADVNSAFGISGNHGFSFTIPASFRNGQSHKVELFGNLAGRYQVQTLTLNP